MNEVKEELRQSCTSYKVRKLMRELSRHYDTELSHVGLKTTQYALLNTVYKVGTIRPTELSNMMRLDNSTLTRNIQVMVSHGFLALEKGQDERSREISITDLGREKRNEAYVYWENAQQKMNHLMTEILQETTKYSQQQILKTENQTALKAKMDAILTPLLQSQ